MDLYLDASDSSNGARAGRKFKPKSKLAPVKAKNVVPVVSELPPIAEEKAATSLTNDLVVEEEKHILPSDAMDKELTDSSGFQLDTSTSAPEKDASEPFLVDADKVPSFSASTACIEPSVLDSRDTISSNTVELHRDSAKDDTVMSPGFEPIQDLADGIIRDNDVTAPASKDDLLASSTFRGHSSNSSLAFKESSTFLELDSGEILCEANGYPDIQNGNECPRTGVNSAMPSDAQCISDAFHLDADSIPGFPPGDAANYSRTSFADFMDSNPSVSDLPRIEEQMDINNSSHADDMHNVRQKEVHDNLEDECDHGQFYVDPPTSSIPGEGDGYFDLRIEHEVDNSAEECRADRNPKKRKASKNPKKPAPDKEKTVRKRKKANELPEKQVEKPQKKFSHSTRRRKERVKELLSIPEDELDRMRLPLKDICLLGQHNMLAKKEANQSRTSGANHSVNNSSHGTYSYDEEDPFGFEQDEEYTDTQNYAREGPSNSLFNSRSFMDREPRARWSKQDTELFYEGIRQFGSNLSMIQQLFPGRTRDHMKKKFQKEGREHPARLTEAMRSQTSDHSYLKMALEQLRKASAHSESISVEDDPDDIVGNEETELDPGTNDEEEATNPKPEEDVDYGDPVVGQQEALDSGVEEYDYSFDIDL